MQPYQPNLAPNMNILRSFRKGVNPKGTSFTPRLFIMLSGMEDEFDVSTENGQMNESKM